ncbi:MAG: lipopolysaccharide kinase InaA family protein [Phycisphaerae bacterium]
MEQHHTTRTPPAQKVRFAGKAARDLLAGRLDEVTFPESHGWEKVKENASRTVYRGSIEGQDIYLKQFRSRTALHRIGRSLGISDALGELHFLQHLTQSGVPTPPPLAACCVNGTEWLATAAVAPCTPADQWHAQQLEQGEQGRRAIRRATRQLGQLVGRMHKAGVIHEDLHCGNVLVRTDTNPPTMVLTDLHRARHRRWLTRRSRAKNLAQLFHDRQSFTSRTDRLRFLKAYLRAAEARGSLRGWQLLVEYFAARHTRGQHAQRDRRIVGNNRYFSRISLPGGWKGHVVLASKRCLAGSRAAKDTFTPGQWKDLLADPETLFTGDDVESRKDTPSGLLVRRTLTIGDRQYGVYIKRPRRKRAWKILPDCLRPARAIRAFRQGHQLLTRRIPTALPLAAIERRVGPLLLDNILITEEVEGRSLHEFLSTHLSNRPGRPVQLDSHQKRILARDTLWQLGRLVQKLHDSNFAHRDLKATNILVHWRKGSVPELVLIDLDGLRSWRHVPIRRRWQGIMRLNVSLLNCPTVNHAGRLRMLLGYLRRPGSGRINFKPWWRMLEDWSAQKLRRQIRSRRRRQRAARRPSS